VAGCSLVTACVSPDGFGAQNPEPPLPELLLPLEWPDVVVVFVCPLVEPPLLEPHAAPTTPKMATIAIGARRRAILR
jgi:hypothetical protein